MAPAQSPWGSFETRVLHFRFKKTLLKNRKWKDKDQRNAQFSFVEEGKLFINKIVHWGIQPCFLYGRAHGLFWNQGSKVFAEFSGTFCALWPRKLRFWKVTYVFYISYTFFSLVLKKTNYKKRPDLRWMLCWICHAFGSFYLRVRSTIWYANCFKGLFCSVLDFQ